MNCANLNCDCEYIIRNESLKYDEDKLAECLSRHSFFQIIASCYNFYFGYLSLNPDTSSNVPTFVRYFYWITAFLVIIGNGYVIISSVVKTSCFKRAWPSVLLQCNHIVILNMAVADFMMGIYLITISMLNVVKFGSNDYNSMEWVGSLGCSIVGSLALISSEASCFLMVTLTSFRLYHVYRPLSFMTASSWPYKVCIFMSWFVAVFLGVFPILKIAPEFYLPNFTVKTSSGVTVMLWEFDIYDIACSLVGLDRSNYSNH